MTRFHTLALAAATLTVGATATASFVPSASAVTAKVSPQIVARPDSVMVNKTTRIVGTHFAAKSTITIKECAQTNWDAPQDPCNTSSSITVTTNAAGRFTGVITIHDCYPSATPGFGQTCYVGKPTPSGIDTIALVGAVPITITAP